MANEQKHTKFDEQNISLLVTNFYNKARNHEVLGPIFNNHIKDHWDEHIEKLIRFWETHLLRSIKYTGSPMPFHHDLKLTPKHFDIWITLFFETIDEIYAGEAVARAKKVTETFVRSFRKKLA